MSRYRVEIDGADTDIEANSIADAEEQARAWVADGSWGEGQCYVRAYITPYTADGEPDSDEWWGVECLVGDEPEEPDCIEGEEHDWQSPVWLGGCRENPGVWGLRGTQIQSRMVCAHCGAYRDYVSESTPGQCPHEPPVTTYREADEQSEAWVREQSEQ
jgi:hypothetical protein